MKAIPLQQNFSSAYDVLDCVFNNTYNGIAVVSMHGNWLKINDSVCDIFIYTRSELFNMDIDSIVFIEDLVAHEKKYKKIDSWRN
jgi:PAS domain S-box-containing protein